MTANKYSNVDQPRSADEAASVSEALMLESLQSMAAARRAFPPQPIEDYALQVPGAPAPRLLSEILGANERLFVIHNMGDGCAHCAVYADGLNGVLPHLESVGSVLLVAPMAPDHLAAYAASRGWRFQLASTRGVTLSADLGLEVAGETWPGTFIVERSKSGLVVSARYVFNPGDHFSPVWPMLALAGIGLDDDDWRPRLSYSAAAQ